jgi:hypothetical protein
MGKHRPQLACAKANTLQKCSAICALHVEEAVLSTKRFGAGLTSLWKVEMWKSSDRLDDS